MADEVVVKKPWQSKTIWLNALGIVALFIPQVQSFVKDNPDVVPSIFAVLNIALRFITKGKIQISD